MRKKAASPPAVSGEKVKRLRRLDLIGGASTSMRRRHGFATMYVSHKSVGVGVLDDPAARPRRAELLDVSEPGTSGRGWNPAPTGLAKAKPESNPNACGVSPFPQIRLEGMRPFSASTTSVDISNKRRPSGGRDLIPLREVSRPSLYDQPQPTSPRPNLM